MVLNSQLLILLLPVKEDKYLLGKDNLYYYINRKVCLSLSDLSVCPSLCLFVRLFLDLSSHFRSLLRKPDLYSEVPNNGTCTNY